MSTNEEMMKKNIKVMNLLEGFNVVVICCSSSLQADFWQKRLEDVRGSVLSNDSIVLAVQEDWVGGAGNALGTLYAYKNASKLALEKFNLNLEEELKKGAISIGLYHTAGKGTRLAPLPGAENNNKPGVKLPATVALTSGERVPITILEAVIKQTGCYAKSRMGRLSVFWGDQVFIPTVPVEYTVTHHADILCSLGPMMSEQEWKEKGMDKYGLIAQNASGGAAQVEKVDHATAVLLLAGLGEIQSVGASLGSFSISHQLLFALLEEFANELVTKEGKLDSDPHLWMPMTLEKPAYLQLMREKGIDDAISATHYDRIQNMTQRFLARQDTAHLGLFGPVDVGQGVYWWDYGQLKLYQKFALLPVESSNESELMRLYFNLTGSVVLDSTVHDTLICEDSFVSSSLIGTAIDSPGHQTGSITRSMVSGVRCRHIQASGAILINVTARSIRAAPGSIIYNVTDESEDGLVVGEGDVLAGVFAADSTSLVLKSHLNTDGGKTWEVVLDANTHSFEQVYNSNTAVCPRTLESVICAAHKDLWQTLHTTSIFTETPTPAAASVEAPVAVAAAVGGVVIEVVDESNDADVDAAVVVSEPESDVLGQAEKKIKL